MWKQSDGGCIDAETSGAQGNIIQMFWVLILAVLNSSMLN